MTDPFYGRQGATVNVDVGAASGNVLVSGYEHAQQIRVCNNGTATAWIKFGLDNTVAATLANDIPIPPGVVEIYTKHTGPIYAAAIAAGATGKIYFTTGGGE